MSKIQGAAVNEPSTALWKKLNEVFNKYQIFSEFFDKNSSQVYTANSGNVWNNPINKYWIFTIPFIEQTNDINISKVVWNHILSKEFHRDRHDMGIAQWQNYSRKFPSSI